MNKPLLNKIAGILNIDAAKLIRAVESTNRGTYRLPKRHSFTDDELGERDQLMRDQGKAAGIEEGTKIGRDLAVKDFKRETGLPIESKHLSDVIRETSRYLQNSETYLKEQIHLLNKKLEEKEAEKQEAETAMIRLQFANKVASALPADRNPKLSDEDYTRVITEVFTLTQQEGKDIVCRNGKPVTGYSGRPLELPVILNGYFEEKGWKMEPGPPPNGRGGKDTTTPIQIYGSLKEMEREWEAQGKKTGTAEFQQHVAEQARNNPNFDFSYSL